MSKMTPKQKEMYFRLSYDYWMDWKTKPEDQRTQLERLGCYVNMFSMMENRIRVFYWTASFYEQFASVLDPKTDIWENISREKYESYSYDPYPPNTPTNSPKLQIDTLKIRHLISNSEHKELNFLIDFGNTITHQSTFQMDKITDEHIDKLLSCFRYIDKKLKSRRSFYLRREKQVQQKVNRGGKHTIKGN